MKKKIKRTGKKIITRLVMLSLLFTLLMPGAALGGDLNNAVLCVAPGKHISVELKGHPGPDESNPDGCAFLCQPHPSGPCTDIPLPKTEPFVHSQVLHSVSSVRANVTAPLSPVELPADAWVSSLHSRQMKIIPPLHSLSALRTVILRI
ncbi:MAG: hypothetical protein GXO70_07220 [Acidobacteria bacterium]|nr:hypothetical protein [Acidobacteriota bacterium]